MSIKFRFSACLVVVLLVWHVPIYTQNNGYKIHYASMSDGLTIREVHDVFMDNHGFIWIAMRASLYRYDGYKFTDFSDIRIRGNNLATKSLSATNFSLIEQLDEQHFYIYSKDDLAIMDLIHTDSLTLKSINLRQLLPASQILNLTHIPSTPTVAVFCKEMEKLVAYEFNPITGKIMKKGSFDLFRDPLTTSTNIQCTATAQGLVFFSSANLPVICFDFQNNSSFKLSIPISKSGHYLLKAVLDNDLYIVNDISRHLWRYTIDSKAYAQVLIPAFQGEVDYCSADKFGNLIVADIANQYFKEIVLLPASGAESVPMSNILKAEAKVTQIRGVNFLNQILVSSFNGIYIFTNEKKQFKALLNRPLQFGAFGHVLRSMVEDDRGNLYIAEDGNNLFKLNIFNDSIAYSIKTSDIDLPTPGTIRIQGDKIWGVRSKSETQRQFYCLNIRTEKFQFFDFPVNTFRVRDFVFIDTVHILYVGYDTRADTLMIWKFNTQVESWHAMSFPTTLRKPMNILQGPIGEFWLGSENGLYYLSLKNYSIEKMSNKLPDGSNNDFYNFALAFRPGSSQLLIGSENGLLILDTISKKYIASFTSENSGISNNFVESILPLDKDKVFLATGMGLSLLDISSGSSDNYFENDGLAHNEFNRLASYKSSNGKYYFGGINGLSVISNQSLQLPKTTKNVSISNFYRYDIKSGKEISTTSNLNTINELTIEADDQYFGFNYMFPDYYEPRWNQFETWLEGYDKSWQSAIAINHVRYGRLPKGEYTFHLRSFPFTGNEKTIRINVKAHFYQSPWFLPGVAFLLLASGLKLFYVYKNKQRDKEVAKQKTEQKFKDLEAAALRAQMNPHFIFNCLGSIQQFIIEHDAASASKYLANFSRLVRLALHSSVDGRHSLQDEIDMLDNYLGLERLRFGDKFTYDLVVDSDLDKEDIFLPPLLIQPFVENALVHGMKNKRDGGKIVISFKQSNNLIHVAVSDNGPGFDIEKRSHDSSGHRSVGMTLTKSRLEILSNQDSFSMTPLIDENGLQAGIRVDIVIPIL